MYVNIEENKGVLKGCKSEQKRHHNDQTIEDKITNNKQQFTKHCIEN